MDIAVWKKNNRRRDESKLACQVTAIVGHTPFGIIRARRDDRLDHPVYRWGRKVVHPPSTIMTIANSPSLPHVPKVVRRSGERSKLFAHGERSGASFLALQMMWSHGRQSGRVTQTGKATLRRVRSTVPEDRVARCLSSHP